MHWYFLIYSYELTILKNVKLYTMYSFWFSVIFGEGGGVNCKFYRGVSENWKFTLSSGTLTWGGISVFGICMFIYLHWNFLINCLFHITSYWQHWTMNSSLSVLVGSDIVSFTWVNLQIWAHFKICTCWSYRKEQWYCVMLHIQIILYMWCVWCLDFNCSIDFLFLHMIFHK